jgi:hypothetical protein
LRLLVTIPAGVQLEKSTEINFVVTDLGLGEKAAAKDHFVLP